MSFSVQIFASITAFCLQFLNALLLLQLKILVFQYIEGECFDLFFPHVSYETDMHHILTLPYRISNVRESLRMVLTGGVSPFSISTHSLTCSGNHRVQSLSLKQAQMPFFSSPHVSTRLTIRQQPVDVQALTISSCESILKMKATTQHLGVGRHRLRPSYP